NNNFYKGNFNYINYDKVTQLAIIGESNNTSSPLSNIVNLLISETDTDNTQLEKKLFDFRYQDKFYKENIQSGLGVSFKHKICKKSSFNFTTLYKNQSDEKDRSSLREYLNPGTDIFEKSREYSQNNLNDFFLDTSYSYDISDDEKLFINSSLARVATKNKLFFNSVTDNSSLKIDNYR